jgi:hypothetical protein
MDALPAPPPGLTGVTLKLKVAVVAATPLPVALTVSPCVPVAAFAPTWRVSVVVVMPPAVCAFDCAAVMPAGAFCTARSTEPVKPPLRVSVAVNDVVPPCCTLALVALSASAIAGV